MYKLIGEYPVKCGNNKKSLPIYEDENGHLLTYIGSGKNYKEYVILDYSGADVYVLGQQIGGNGPRGGYSYLDSKLTLFTVRELEIIALVKQAKSNKQIAEELGVGIGTVISHLRNIFIKLKIKSRAELIIKEL